MNKHEEPLVSVVTPVYNREDFLSECIESVLGQTYTTLEYVIVDNCSTDRSLEIASCYARKDSRVRVHKNKSYLEIIANHNLAFNLISPRAKYCKVVSDFDIIFPDCIKRMVDVAEGNPSAGIIGSYQLSGSKVRWEGLEYPRAVVPGVEMCHRVLLGDSESKLGFGTPTSSLYRADLVRAEREFYPNASPHADASACFKYLSKCDYGFVYQVLSYARAHAETESSKSREINRFASASLGDLAQYGPLYLSKRELERLLKQQLNNYHRYLAVNVVRRRGKEFWNYHRSALAELGFPLKSGQLLKAGMKRGFAAIINPGPALSKFWGTLSLSGRRLVRAQDKE